MSENEEKNIIHRTFNPNLIFWILIFPSSWNKTIFDNFK